MLANHFQNGIETARLVWSRIPNSEESRFLDDGVGILKKNDGSGVESLDYEVIENFAYRAEQVFFFFFISFFLKKKLILLQSLFFNNEMILCCAVL